MSIPGGPVGPAEAFDLNGDQVAAIPPGCSRYSISIKKPLGIILEQRSTGGIYVVRGGLWLGRCAGAAKHVHLHCRFCAAVTFLLMWWCTPVTG